VFLLLRRVRTLVIPIGPPAAGKTTLWRTLNEEESASCKRIVEPFERDRKFADERVFQGGLRGAKQRTHAALLVALREGAISRHRPPLYVDSTNGQRSARLAYRVEFHAERVLYCILGFDGEEGEPIVDVDVCFERVLARHQCRSDLPAHEKRQWEDAVCAGLRPKLERMLSALEPVDADELSCKDCTVSVLRSPAIDGHSDMAWRLFLELVCPALARIATPSTPVTPARADPDSKP